jgi:hypothetical protein
MRARRQTIGASAACIVLAIALPTAAQAAMRPFVMPRPRPTEAARPTDRRDPNRNSYTVPEAPSSPQCTRNFCVHWVDQGLDAPNLADADGDGIPDYVEEVEAVAEHVHAVENGRLHWREPRSDGRVGGRRGKTDIYLVELGGALFGYAAPDRRQASKGHRLPRKLHGYLVLDNDYAPSEFPGTSEPDDLDVTLAHEYNHILQFGYDAYQDPWFAESTAVWMEDQVYNGINDYLRYIRRWTRRSDTPLTTSSIKEYGSAVWNDWLTHRYGRGFLRRAWARAIRAKPGGFSVGAYEAAIRAAGHSSFSRDFARFCRDTAEWRTDTVFREGNLYPDVARQGHLPTSGRRLRRYYDHATCHLLRVRPSRGRAVVAHALAPVGTASAIALVGRIGGERRGRTVSRLRFKAHGGRMTVRLRRPGRFSRITAVAVNADATARGFDTRRLDWRYLRDGIPFELSADLVR